MKSEELFQIDRQINRIKRLYQQRRQGINDWNVPIQSVLKQKINKRCYLQKKYSQSHLQFYQSKQNNLEQAKKSLLQHSKQSRMKVQQFNSDLHQLHDLIKKRTLIHLTKIQDQNIIKSKQLEQKSKLANQKDFSKTLYTKNQSIKKKQREIGVFQNLKGQKLLQILQESKNKFASNEQAVNNVKKQLGIGLQNTPFYAWLQQKNHSEKLLLKNKSKCIQASSKQVNHYDLFKLMDNDIKKKKNIYLSANKQLGKNFEQRLKRIIKYHKQNVQGIKMYKTSI